MALRKEQVLLLLTLAIGGLVGRGYFEEPDAPARYSPERNEYAAAAVTPAPLAAAVAPAVVRRDFCTEPSETQPLPPRELDFPPRAALTLAALMLDLGPDYGHLWKVQVDGGVVDGVTLQQPAEAAAPADASAPVAQAPPVNESYADKEKRAALIYDRVYYNGLASPMLGTLEASGVDLFALEKSNDFQGVQLHLRRFSIERQKVEDLLPIGNDKYKIDRIVLAGTLRNEVARRIHNVPDAQPQARRELIEWMLEKAREASWIYDEALKQAELYTQETGANLEGLRLQQRVLRARGDLAGELKLLDGLSGALRESAFRYEALGWLKSQLGLFLEAEADLKKAVSLAATDARPHGALADFLRRRDRSREALAAAKRCEQTLGSVQEAADKARLQRIIAACYLAVADTKSALSVTQSIDVHQAQPYLEGCVLYASGDTAGALAAFRQASGSQDGSAALLGQAACLLRDGQWQEAHDLLLRIGDQDPLLRYRAATGLALLFCRLGQLDTAVVWVDRALEADPTDAYAHYLRGCIMRRLGQLSAAEQSLATALRRHDDFVHAIAEMAAVKSAQMDEGSGLDQAEAAVAARRFSDRAVALVYEPSIELREWQGLNAFRAADPLAAREAFLAARDLAGNDLQKNYTKGAIAVIDYSRGLVDDAEPALDRMTQDLGHDEPLAKWAAATMVEIQDHAQKEALGDGFDRDKLGSVWHADTDGFGPDLRDGRLVMQGTFAKGGSGEGEVAARREGAVPKGKNFLAVSVSMQLGATQSPTDGFAGLGIEITRGNGGVELQARVGIRERAPYLRIQDGQDNGREAVETPALAIDGFDLTKSQDLELRVVPRGDDASKQLTLVVSWNGVVVHRHDLKQLTGSTTAELRTLMFAKGGKGSRADVSFDDYRLERKKDR